MPNKRISQYGDGVGPLPTDLLVAARAGDNVKLSVAELLPTFNVKGYGALGDGATDDTAAIQAAINAANAAGGGTVLFPKTSSFYVVNGTLTLDNMQNIALVGGIPTTRAQYGTAGGVYLKRVSGTGTLLSWVSTSLPLYGCSIKHLGFDANALATTGVLLGDWYGSHLEDIFIRNATTVCLDLVGGNSTLGWQDNVALGVAIRVFDGAASSGIGMRWRSYAAGGTNVSLNNFYAFKIYHKDGTALDCGDSDSNNFFGLEMQNSGNAGVGILLRGSTVSNQGHCRDNEFNGVQPVSGVTAQGLVAGRVTASDHNIIYANTANNNSIITPTIETGATLGWYQNNARSSVGAAQDIMSAAGYAAWSFDPRLCQNGINLASQWVTAQAAYVKGGTLVTGIALITHTAGVGTSPTGLYVGLADRNGKILVKSNNIVGTGAEAGFKALNLHQYPFSTTYTVKTTDLYYLVFLQNGAYGTTAVALAEGAFVGSIALGQQLGSNPFLTAYQSGQAALPAVGSSLTLGSGAQFNIWMGLY